MRASLLSVGTGKIKSQNRFRFDGRQPSNVGFTPGKNSKKASLTPDFIAQPVATLDHQELKLYIDTVAKECDRFEYILTGSDSH